MTNLENIKEIKECVYASIKNENKDIKDLGLGDLREYATIINDNGFYWSTEEINKATKEIFIKAKIEAINNTHVELMNNAITNEKRTIILTAHATAITLFLEAINKEQ